MLNMDFIWMSARTEADLNLLLVADVHIWRTSSRCDGTIHLVWQLP